MMDEVNQCPRIAKHYGKGGHLCILSSSATCQDKKVQLTGWPGDPGFPGRPGDPGTPSAPGNPWKKRDTLRTHLWED